MKKGLVILVSGFEDSEAIVTIDILKRAKVALDIVSATDSLNIITQYNNELLLKKQLCDCTLDDYDFLFIPGGGAVKRTLINLKIVEDTIKSFALEKKLIATICAAPMLVGKLDLFANEQFTCFPSCEEGIKGKYIGKGVQVSNNFITGKSMAYSIDFALEIVNYLLGKEEMKKVEKAIYGK